MKFNKHLPKEIQEMLEKQYKEHTYDQERATGGS